MTSKVEAMLLAQVSSCAGNEAMPKAPTFGWPVVFLAESLYDGLEQDKGKKEL